MALHQRNKYFQQLFNVNYLLENHCVNIEGLVPDELSKKNSLHLN